MEQPIDILRPDQTIALREKNLKFFERYIPDVHRRLMELQPKSELVWQDDGDINIRDENNVFRYSKGARADSLSQVKLAKKAPTRVLFQKPALKTKEQIASDEKLNPGDFDGDPNAEFLTRRYDNKATDDHMVTALDKINRAFIEAGVTDLAEAAKAKGTYYLSIYGVGLGFHIKPLVEAFDPQVVIIAESDIEALHHSSFTFDWTEFYEYMDSHKKKIRIIIDKDSTTILQKVSGTIQGECLLGLDGVISFLHTTDPVLKVAFNEFQSPKTANLASFIGFIVDEYNMMKNSFRNLKGGTKRMLATVRKKTDLPAIIVGSGPSLEWPENIEFLRKAQDRALIFTSGSNLAVLLKHGIKPDIHVNLERAKSIYERHTELKQYEAEMKEIYTVLTSTIWPGIDAFFKDAVYFLRPALSPVAVFCEEDANVLYNEGPQVTNTAYAFARRLGVKEFYFVGVDLGAVDPKRPRAADAWQGIRPRHLTVPVRGNLGRTVFTDAPLTQQRATLESQLRKLSADGGRAFNLGGGVRIEGAQPKRAADTELPTIAIDKKQHVQDLIEQFPVFTRERFLGCWRSAQVRDNVAGMINDMIVALEKSHDWDNALLRRIEEINAYVGKSLRNQYAPRLLRGSLLRICMHVNSVFNRLKEPEKSPEIYAKVREAMIDFLRELEMECYSLADELESEDEAFAAQFA